MSLESIISIPFGAFILLWGLLWEPKKKTKKDLKLEKALIEAGELEAWDEDDFGVEALSPSQKRNYLRRVAQRMLMLFFGLLFMFIAFIRDFGGIDHPDAFFLLFALYAGGILLVQRAEKPSRVLVLFTMSVAGLLLWRTAIFYEYNTENGWALLAALGANLLFWLTIGQMYPPGSSDSIEVIGMEG